MNAEQQEYQNVATSALKESPLNPRRTFDKKAIEELEKSIRETGKVLTPLLVSPIAYSENAAAVRQLNGMGGSYEVLAGARRLRCAIKIGLETVPVRVLEGLTEAQKVEIQIIENLQRADVHPLEEAQAFQTLLKIAPASGGANYVGKAETDQKLKIQDIAEKVGMSQEYVYGRLKLLELAPKSTKLFQEGKIEAGHAILLARLEPAEQEAVIKEEDWQIKHGELSVRGLQEAIQSRARLKKWKAEQDERRKKEAAERKSGKGKKQKSWREQQEEQNRKYEAEHAKKQLQQQSERVARVKTVEAILVKVKWPLPKSVYRLIAGDLKGELKDSEIPRAIITELLGEYDQNYAWAESIRNVKILANIYGVKPVKPEPIKVEPAKEATPAPAKASKSKPRSKKKKLQTSAKAKRASSERAAEKKAVA